MSESNYEAEEYPLCKDDESGAKEAVIIAKFKGTRFLWIDVLNCIACFGVLLLHSTNKALWNWSGDLDYLSGLCIFTHSFFLWPVDVFFMISGYNLINRKWSDSDSELLGDSEITSFYKRRLKRLFIPVLFWNCVYSALLLIISGMPAGGVPSILKTFLCFEGCTYMWFFVPLIIIYISLPFFQVLVRGLKRKQLKLFLIIGAIGVGILPSIISATGLHKWDNSFPLCAKFLWFTAAGYYFGKYDIKSSAKKLIIIAGFIGIVLLAFGNVFFSIHSEIPNVPMEYTSIVCMAVAVMVFVTAKTINWERILEIVNLTPKQIGVLSGLSLGIYLSQGFWFGVYKHILPDWLGQGLLICAIMWITCAVFTFIVKKVPVLKNIV